MLDGKTIAITRSKDDASEFITLAEQNKATPIALPTIELVGKGEKIVDEFLNSVKQNNPDYTLFLSSKAVKLLFDTAKSIEKFDELQLAVANSIVMSVGPKTTLSLESYGIKVNHEPENHSSVGVGEEFSQINAVGKKVIIPRSAAANSFLKELLNKIGIDVVEIFLYDVCAFSDLTQWNGFRELFSQRKVDGVIFTSASSVRGFFEIMLKDYEKSVLVETLSKLSLVAIGPFTSEELKKLDISHITSKVHTVVGAFDTMSLSLD
ncbi:MAG: uroporphyrinogen-III synthase [Thaumarchaeota archaeon]|jgi:uroporphyrinogen-III synthase|nr:uroporphyrinogen-III synthase [Nitrososphaerota archaeon]MBT5843311.1 uroporphyrinogen-III synthase [Nitrososphaerota archaeon]MBT6468892.1 uroporphyrinogen-III synthase [Nitrososphaerota archaeon]